MTSPLIDIKSAASCQMEAGPCPAYDRLGAFLETGVH